MSRMPPPNGVTVESDGDDAPRPIWPDRVVYHGTRVGLLLAVAVAITLLFPKTGTAPSVARYSVGSVATADVIASVDFDVPKNAADLAREQEAAAASMPATFDLHPEAADTMAARLGVFFARLDSVAQGGDPGAVERFLGAASLTVSADQVQLLADPARRVELRDAAMQAIRGILASGVVESGQAAQLSTDQVYIRDPGAVERAVSREEVLTAGQFYDRAVDLLRSGSPDLRGLLRLIIIRHTEYTLVPNVLATEADRDAARRSVQVTRARIVQGEAIVRANTQITEDGLDRLNAYEAELRTRGLVAEGVGIELLPMLGGLLLNFLLLAVYGAMILFARREQYANIRWLVLQGLLILGYFGVARAVASNGLPHELLPIAFVSLSVAVLWDARIALVLTLVLAAITSAQGPFQNSDVLFLVLVGGAAAAMSVRVVLRRSQTWVFIAITTAAYALTLLALALIAGSGVTDTLWRVLWVGSNAALSAIIAMGFVPVYEWFTRITTDQTLLEWADPNRPLLRRLAMEAPGTYAHTIQVANLCEIAANAIGANGLRCRAGIYYHDVGKVLKPHYFVENQPEGRNPHDKLKPHTSAAIVRDHVVEGLQLAKDDRVPAVLSSFISEHHGTQLISYFYEKALEDAGDESVDEADFRYPGPRPSSKETAIAMLGDSVESAARVLREPTPERVSDLIDSIVETKLSDGQLDDAPLTLREIAMVKEQFLKVLGGSFHHRVEYATTKHLTGAPEADPAEEEESGERAAEAIERVDHTEQMEFPSASSADDGSS